MEMIAQQRNQRDEHLASGEDDKIDQSKYSKETNLVRRERNGLRIHAELARRPTRDLVERRPEVISLCSAFQDYMMTKNSAHSTNATTSDRLTTVRSEEHTSELQSHSDLVCRLLLEKKKLNYHAHYTAG